MTTYSEAVIVDSFSVNTIGNVCDENQPLAISKYGAKVGLVLQVAICQSFCILHSEVNLVEV